jgi:hypothetical protein
MSTAMILAPLFVQALLTFAVMFGMMAFRTHTLQSGATRFEDIAMREPNWPRQAALCANSFSNQFELPVLFYVLTVLAMFTKHADFLFVVLAWIFVLFRALQAYIHVTSNNVRFRGGYYFIAAMVLVIMWLIFIVKIMLGLP